MVDVCLVFVITWIYGFEQHNICFTCRWKRIDWNRNKVNTWSILDCLSTSTNIHMQRKNPLNSHTFMWALFQLQLQFQAIYTNCTDCDGNFNACYCLPLNFVNIKIPFNCIAEQSWAINQQISFDVKSECAVVQI